MSGRRRTAALIAGAGIVLGSALAACSADGLREAAIRELAIGTWTCAPDAKGADQDPFTVRIDRQGSFLLAIDRDPVPADAAVQENELSGTWTIGGGDLRWSLDDSRFDDAPTVEGFDDLTLDSERFTLGFPGIFEPKDGSDDPASKLEVLVDAHGPDSVTFRVPDGDPWTCDRT